MLYPSIQELLKATAKEDGSEKLNKYSVVMATAKCARMITNDYIEQRHIAERKVANKETDKDISSLVNKNYRDEKAVKNALREMKEGKFEVYLPGEEGYDSAIVDVVDYVEPKEEYKPFKQMFKDNNSEETTDENEETAVENGEAYDDFDSKELMNAEEVFNNEEGFNVAESDSNVD